MPRFVLASAALALALGLGASGARADEPRARVARAPVPLDGIAAIVDDVVIFRSDVATRAKRFEPQLSKDPTKRRAELASMDKQLLNAMIDEILVAKDAKAQSITVTDPEVSAAITTIAQQNKIDRKALDEEVKKAGFTPAEYQEEVKRQLTEQKWLMLRAVGKIDRKKTPDDASFLAAIEKQRALLVADLRSRAFIEIR